MGIISTPFKFLTRTFFVLMLAGSLAINGALLISASGAAFLSGLLDNIGIKTPYASLQQNNKSLRTQNQQLNRQQTNTRRAVRKHNQRMAKRMAGKAIKKGVSVGAKVATAFVPLAANAALLTSAAVEADEIRQYCNEMDELNELANEIGIADHQAERKKVCGVSLPDPAVFRESLPEIELPSWPDLEPHKWPEIPLDYNDIDWSRYNPFK